MQTTMQVLYPTEGGSSFDHGYYMDSHMRIVGETLGPHIQSMQVVKGRSSAPDTPPAYHVIATIVFADQAAMDKALANSRAATADITNFYSGRAQILFGEVVL